MKHAVCHIEFCARDLDRATAFYCGLFGWTIVRAAADEVLFRSPDGLQGTIRRVETVTPNRLPLLRIEVDDYGPVVEMAARFQGGYSGFVDPIQGDWAVHLRDPDGNLIRLARTPWSSAAAEPERGPWVPEPTMESTSPEAVAVVPSTRKLAHRANGHAQSNGNGARTNGRQIGRQDSRDSQAG